MPSEVARLWLGGRGLGAYLALRERLYEVEPLAPENLLIFAPGPLTGTGAPASGRYSVTSRSPLTGTVFDGNSGGNFGNALRRLGWDYLILIGALDDPGYVTIGLDGRRRGFAGRAAPHTATRPGPRPYRSQAPAASSLHPAAGLWGLDVPASLSAPARAAPQVRGRRDRPGRRARRAVREHRQQPGPVHRARRPRRRHGRQAPQGARRRRPRRAQAARGRPRAPRLHRLRGREAAQVQPDHLHGAARVRDVGARQRARPGRRPAHAQPPRDPVRGRGRHLRRGAQARARAAQDRLPRLHHRLRPPHGGGRAERRGPRVREHLGVRGPVRCERPDGDRAGQLRLQPRRHGHHHHGLHDRLRHGAHRARAVLRTARGSATRAPSSRWPRPRPPARASAPSSGSARRASRRCTAVPTSP